MGKLISSLSPIEGEYYKVKLGAFEYIILYYKGSNCKYVVLTYGYDVYREDGNFDNCQIEKLSNFISATPEQIEHLNVCIAANKYISVEDIPKPTSDILELNRLIQESAKLYNI